MMGALNYQYVLTEETRILVIDDDPIHREFASVYLATPSTQIQTAPDAIEGLTLLKKEMVDILLVDVEMPIMSGIELVRKLRGEPRFLDLPIIVITARDDIVAIDEAYAAGATAFVCKPVNWRLLSYEVKFVLRASRALAQLQSGRP